MQLFNDSVNFVSTLYQQDSRWGDEAVGAMRHPIRLFQAAIAPSDIVETSLFMRITHLVFAGVFSTGIPVGMIGMAIKACQGQPLDVWSLDDQKDSTTIVPLNGNNVDRTTLLPENWLYLSTTFLNPRQMLQLKQTLNCFIPS